MGREVPLLCVKGMRGKEFASDSRKNKTIKKQIETYTVPRNKPAFEAATVNEQAGRQLKVSVARHPEGRQKTRPECDSR